MPVAGTILLPKLEDVSADLLLAGLDKPVRLSGQAKSPAGLLSFEATAPPRRLLDGGAVPIVIRLDGTNADEGRAILEPHLSDTLQIEPTMVAAAQRVVELAKSRGAS